jgi:hypothetical protein
MRKITLFFSVLALSSCVTIKLAKGPIEERTIIIPEGATALVTSHGADVTVDYSLRPNEVRVKTHSDMFDILKVEVEDSTLSIGIKQNSLYAKTFEVRVPILAYNTITASGGADIEWHDCRAEMLTIAASGGADIDIEGECGDIILAVSGGADAEMAGHCVNLTVAASGGADADLDDLKTMNVEVSASGGADVAVHATKALTVNASGGADVAYSGNPESKDIIRSGGADVYQAN